MVFVACVVSGEEPGPFFGIAAIGKTAHVSCEPGPDHAPDIDPVVDSITTEEGLETSN